MTQIDLAGQINGPDASTPTLDIEAEGDHATLYFDEGAGCYGFTLTRKQLQEFTNRCEHVLRQIDWNIATWVFVHYSGPWHVQRIGTHGVREKALCGALPPIWGDYMSAWDLAPAQDTHILTPMHDLCKRCLKTAQKEIHAGKQEREGTA